MALLDGTPAYSDDHRPFTTKELASGASSHLELGADGAFSFRGLKEGRAYRVRGWNQKTLEQDVSEQMLAGTRGYVRRVPDEPWRARVEGVVVGLDGFPLADVTCRLSMNEYKSESGTWMTSGQTW